VVVENWRELVGQHVQVKKDGQLIRTGYVSDVTYAANAMWLEHHGGHLRHLFEKVEGYSAELAPAP
jgi:hypothetical protein